MYCLFPCGMTCTHGPLMSSQWVLTLSAHSTPVLPLVTSWRNHPRWPWICTDYMGSEAYPEGDVNTAGQERGAPVVNGSYSHHRRLKAGCGCAVLPCKKLFKDRLLQGYTVCLTATGPVSIPVYISARRTLITRYR